MADVKFTKNALRTEQLRLAQLSRYLPTLQLKKALIQSEVNNACAEKAEYEKKFLESKKLVDGYAGLFKEETAVDYDEIGKVEEVIRDHDNIAGVDIPVYNKVIFKKVVYMLFEAPAWLDFAINNVHTMVEDRVRVKIVEEKIVALRRELREVSIRVNLFEKVLIPRSKVSIRKISVFLGDQELAAVSQAKVAKKKIELYKQAHIREMDYAS